MLFFFHRNRYSKHGIHPGEETYENSAMLVQDARVISAPNGEPVFPVLHPRGHPMLMTAAGGAPGGGLELLQEEFYRNAAHRSPRKTQLFVQV